MRNFKKILGFTLAILLLSGSRPPSLFAEEFGGNPGTKLTRGLINTTTGWLEIPAQMAEQKKTDTTQVMWFFHGLLRGMTVGVARTAYGLWEMITFPVAPYNDPYMQPDTLIDPKAKHREPEPPAGGPSRAAPNTNFTHS